MNNIIIGTAGHVDHGKTCLIRALTGIDTDRLKEEKQRGITIELGFADMRAPDGTDIGIIDVPGHEKFIRNMLSGIGGIDLVLLVIAADEGVMPQTLEHLDILKLLNIRRGIIVVTKSDVVDEEWMELVHADIRATVKGSFLEQAPIIDVSSKTGHQIDLLRDMIFEMVKVPGKRNSDPGLLRMPIDRVFTIGGFGTVVTGTLLEGTIQVGQPVMIYPQERTAKVRNLQVHGMMVDSAEAGQRTAVNLTNIKKEDLSRGQVLAACNSLRPTLMLDVRLHLLESTKRKLENGSRLHFHFGSDEVLCKAVLLDRDELLGGDSCYAQLRLEAPIALKQGDYFVVRYYSPLETIGGGSVLDAYPKKHKRKDISVLDALEIKEKGEDSDLLELMIKEQSRVFPDVSALAKQAGMTLEETLAHCRSGVDRGTLAGLTERVFVHSDFIAEAAIKAGKILNEYHKKEPLSPGIVKEEFRNKLGLSLRVNDQRHLEKMIALLAEREILQWEATTVALSGFQVEYTEKQKAKMEELKQSFRTWSHEPPETDDILNGCADRQECRALLGALASEGALVRLNPATYIDAGVLSRVIEEIKHHIETQGSITLAELRDKLQTSRKYAMQILEYCDGAKITRLEGDRRVFHE